MRILFCLFAALALSTPVRSAAPLQLTLPPAVYAVPGVPMSVYYDNIVLTETPGQYRFQVKCDLGTNEERRWTVTPTDKDVGEHAMEITVKDAQDKVLESGRMKLRIAPRNAGEGRPLRLLIVGDSLTNATHYPNEIARLLSEPGNPKWTMLGTNRPSNAKPGVGHEGYGGWRWETFLTRWEAQPAGVAAGPLAKRTTSPFLFADAKADGKGKLDLPRYFKEHCGGEPPDVVTFLLGINDCFGANPDDPAAMIKVIDAALDNADKLLAAFHVAAPKAVLAVGLTTPPNARESGFEANYKGRYHRWGWKRIQHRLVQRMMERMSGREKEGIFLVPTELNIDPVDGYPVDNGVHPNKEGYAQIGASFYAWVKAWMAVK
jgi:lysophospholipase L1-like esterase